MSHTHATNLAATGTTAWPTNTGGSGASARPDILGGPEQSVIDPLRDRLSELGLDVDAATRLAEGLSVLAPARFRLTATEPPLVVLRSATTVDPAPLLDLLTDDDLTTALELAVGGLPPGYWAISAFVANIVHLEHSRRRVGQELEWLTTPAALAAPS